MNRLAYTSAEQFCDVRDTAGRKFRGQCSQKLIYDCYVNSRLALEFLWSIRGVHHSITSSAVASSEGGT